MDESWISRWSPEALNAVLCFLFETETLESQVVTNIISTEMAVASPASRRGRDNDVLLFV